MARAVGGDSLALGVLSAALEQNAVAIGASAQAGQNGVALGASAQVRQNGVAVGHWASAQGVGAVAIGIGASAQHAGATAIGQNAQTTADSQVRLGGAGSSVAVGDIAASTAAQVGPVEVVTVDAYGTLGRQHAASSAQVAEVSRSVASASAASGRPQGAPASIALVEDIPLEDLRPPLRGDAELIRRAVDNALRNAQRFAPAESAVEVEVRYLPEERSYIIEVTDRGPGIPEGHLAAIFEPFVRGEDKSDGLGLGLAIASRAIVAHGGTIEARNRDGGGLVIRIKLACESF